MPKGVMMRIGLSVCVLLLVGTGLIGVAKVRSAPLSGVFEACFGVDDLIGEIAYWERFGYKVDRSGRLSESDAAALYGVSSGVTAVRLRHNGGADHGLVRLFDWDVPLGPGLGTADLLVPGSRWVSTLTEDVLRVLNHAQQAARSGAAMRIVVPQFSQIYAMGAGRAYLDPAYGVREMVVMDRLRRRVFFERFNYSVPNFGTIAPDSRFRSSQITHQGVVFAGDDPALTDFYDGVLGLKRNGAETLRSYESFNQATRNVYAMQPGQKYWGTTFDNPSTEGQTLDTVKSGRLLMRRIGSDHGIAGTVQDKAGPGYLGLTLFTYRAENIAHWQSRIRASEAREVGPIRPNAFGEPSFRFTAPDGTLWMIVETTF